MRNLLTTMLALAWVQSICCNSNHRAIDDNTQFENWLASKQRLPLKVSDYDIIADAYKHRESPLLSQTLAKQLLPYIVRELMQQLQLVPS